MYSEIRDLYHLCFNDDEEYENAFFDTVYNPDDVVIKRVSGKIVAMTFCTPCQLCLREHPQSTAPAFYINSFCTHPDYRGRGYAAEIMQEALSRGEQRGDMFALLIPATPSLFDYYARFGFATCFDRDERQATTAHLKRGCIASMPRWDALRKAYNKAPAHCNTCSTQYGMARIVNIGELDKRMIALFGESCSIVNSGHSIPQLTQACVGYQVETLPPPLNTFPKAQPALHTMLSD